MLIKRKKRAVKHLGNNSHQGFTLIEVMIVLVILAILSTIAYPSYVDHVIQSRRTDAQAALLNIASLQEKFYFHNNKYSNNLLALYGGLQSPEGFYDLEVEFSVNSVACSEENCFTLRAIAANQQSADDDCAVYELTHSGERRAEKSDASLNNQCW